MRSYYDVFNEIQSDKDKLAFIKAVFNKQFHNKDTELTGEARFAYISQMHHIESSVKGYEDKSGVKLNELHKDLPSKGSRQGVIGSPEPANIADKEIRKKEEYTYRKFAHLSLSLNEFNKINKKYSKEQIDEVLDAIENYKQNKNYTSLNLTAQAWLKKRHPDQKTPPKNVEDMTDGEKLKFAMGTLK